MEVLVIRNLYHVPYSWSSALQSIPPFTITLIVHISPTTDIFSKLRLFLILERKRQVSRSVWR